MRTSDGAIRLFCAKGFDTTEKGWASVDRTNFSRSKTWGEANIRKKYFNVSAMKKDSAPSCLSPEEFEAA